MVLMPKTIAISVLLSLLIPCSVLAAGPLEPDRFSGAVMREMVGERHSYTLDFLVFKGLAEGKLQLTAEKVAGRYRAELIATTLGVTSWLTGDRIQSYVSIMEEDGTGRLRSVSYESSIVKRKKGDSKDRQKRYRFDYEAGKIYQEKGENGQYRPGLVFELPADRQPVDILTGFYNLRAGAYGALTPGAKIKIPTFTTKGIAEIEVDVLTEADRENRPFPAAGTLLRIKVDPEVFDTAGADVYAWFDEAGRPASGVVKNVAGLGDVYGRRNEKLSQP